MKQSFCLSCNKKLQGRIDKKYCDSYCKSAYHNQYKSKHELVISTTNVKLRKNRSVLAYFSPEGKATVRKSVLVQAGYDFSLFTTFFSFTRGTYYFCYDYGFLPIIDNKGIEKVVIVQKQEYMNTVNFNPWNIK